MSLGFGFHGNEEENAFFVKGKKRDVTEAWETVEAPEKFCTAHQYLGEEEGGKKYKCLGHKLEGRGELVDGNHGCPAKANMFFVYDTNEAVKNRWDTHMTPEEFCQNHREAEEGEGDSMFSKAKNGGYVCMGHTDIGNGFLTHTKPTN
eukprot:GHVN01037359.1.p1 GENE.GHVN01037359.1~~GHVN01037359.1.p1  ORF type:complete len:148 (-),score=35.21 GHVN01037359.1:689-1132(-)